MTICAFMYRTAVVLTVFFLCTANALATRLSFEDALERAATGADVQAARRALQLLADSNRRLSPLTSNPEIGIVPGTRQPEGASSWGPEGYVYARQTLNLGGWSAARRYAATFESQEMAARLSALLLSRQTEAANLWTALWAAERARAVALEELPLAESIVERVRFAVESGVLTALDLVESEAYLSETRLKVLEAQSAEFEAALALARVVGTETPLRTDGVLPATPVDADALRTLPARSVNGATVVAARRAAESERARARESAASQGIELHLGVEGGTEVDAKFAAATVGVTLPLFNRGEREAGVQFAAAAELDGQSQRAALDARLDALDALYELKQTGERLRETRDRLLPAQERAAQYRERLALAGEATTLELLIARRLVVATRGLVAQAEADHAFARVRLWLINQSLTPESP